MNRTSGSVFQSSERREHLRVTVSIPGRYMLEDKREFPCRTVDFSANGVSLAAPVRGKEGERIVVYLDYIGRIEGFIVRQTMFGFALALSLPGNKREKIADQLTWLMNRDSMEKADRRHDRIMPNRRHCLLKLEDGREHIVKLINISVSGAAISTELKLPLETKVLLGATSGRVVRLFDNGVAVEFDTQIPINLFDEEIQL